jgi:hypothetical protein
MVVSEIALYNTLKSKLGEQEAQIVVEGIKQTVDTRFSEQKDIFLTKEDKVDLIKWMFAFWVGSIGVLSGVMFAMLNAYLRH